MDIILRDESSHTLGDDGEQGSNFHAMSRQKSVYLRSPNTLQVLAMEAISKNREFYENKFTTFTGFKFLTPPVLQMLIEYIDERTDRFLTPNFAKLLINENTHYANIGSVDERFRQEVYDYVIKHCCGLRLKIIKSLWVDGNLNIMMSDLLRFKNLQGLELLQLECTDEVLQTICIHFPKLRSLAVTFKDEYVSEDGIGCLESLVLLETFSFKVDEEDACYYRRMLDDLNRESNLNLQIKQFVVSGLKKRITLENKNPARKPVAERIGSYLKKRLVRAFSKELELK